MTLEKWLKSKRKTAAQFAAETGLVPSTISRIKRGTRRPDWSSLDIIFVATAGSVAPNDFLSSDSIEAVATIKAVKKTGRGKVIA